MISYETLKVEAKERGCKVNELIALAPQNDPFYTGAPAELDKVRWFAGKSSQHEQAEGKNMSIESRIKTLEKATTPKRDTQAQGESWIETATDVEIWVHVENCVADGLVLEDPAAFERAGLELLAKHLEAGHFYTFAYDTDQTDIRLYQSAGRDRYVDNDLVETDRQELEDAPMGFFAGKRLAEWATEKMREDGVELTELGDAVRWCAERRATR